MVYWAWICLVDGYYIEPAFHIFRKGIETPLLHGILPSPFLYCFCPVQAPHAIQSRPSLEQGVLTVGTSGKAVYGLERQSGRALWSFPTGENAVDITWLLLNMMHLLDHKIILRYHLHKRWVGPVGQSVNMRGMYLRGHVMSILCTPNLGNSGA